MLPAIPASDNYQQIVPVLETIYDLVITHDPLTDKFNWQVVDSETGESVLSSTTSQLKWADAMTDGTHAAVDFIFPFADNGWHGLDQAVS